MKNNVKEHPASSEDTQNNQTDGRGLDVSSCSASSYLVDPALIDRSKLVEAYKTHKEEANIVGAKFTLNCEDAMDSCRVWLKKVLDDALLSKD
jgi:hypothetical protein